METSSNCLASPMKLCLSTPTLTTMADEKGAAGGANMAHKIPSRQDSGLGCQVKVLKTFYVVSSSLGRGDGWVKPEPKTWQLAFDRPLISTFKITELPQAYQQLVKILLIVPLIPWSPHANPDGRRSGKRTWRTWYLKSVKVHP